MLVIVYVLFMLLLLYIFILSGPASWLAHNGQYRTCYPKSHEERDDAQLGRENELGSAARLKDGPGRIQTYRFWDSRCVHSFELKLFT